MSNIYWDRIYTTPNPLLLSKILGLLHTEDFVCFPGPPRKTTNTTTMAAAARNGPLAPHIEVKNSTTSHQIDRRQCPKQEYTFLWRWCGLNLLKFSSGVAMMAMNLASPSERFGALDRFFTGEKHIRLIRKSPICRMCCNGFFGIFCGAWC